MVRLVECVERVAAAFLGPDGVSGARALLALQPVAIRSDGAKMHFEMNVI
jgi:hypothetical protein